MPIAVGVVIALGVHGLKATARPVANVATAGVAAPVISTVEDVVSTVLSLVAVILPILVLVGLVFLALGFRWLFRRRAARRARRRAVAEQRRAR